MRFTKLMATTALISMLPATAFAQTASGQAGEDAGAVRAADGLEEIVVTAQRRVENAQKAAVPISVLSSASLERAGISAANQLSTAVPGLQISATSGTGMGIYIRGVGTGGTNSYTDPGVAFSVDGIYIGRPASVKGVFFDLERVEVLKGPQGTLYGRNATGGAVNVLPKLPRIGESSGFVSGGYGNYNGYEVEGAVNVPLGENLAVRLAGTASGHDATLSDGTNNEKSVAFRGQLLFKPSSDLTLRVSADYAHDGGSGLGSVIAGVAFNPTGGFQPAVVITDPVARNVGLLDPRSTAVLASQYDFLAGRFGVGVPDSTGLDNAFWGISAQADLVTGIGTVTAIASHRESDINSKDLASGFLTYADQSYKQSSIELRIASEDSGLLRYQLGGYYFRDDVESLNNYNVINLSSNQAQDFTTQSLAGFVRLVLAPTERLRVVGGARITHDIKDYDAFNKILTQHCYPSVFPIPSCQGTAPFRFAPTIDAQFAQLGLVPLTDPAILADPAWGGFYGAANMFMLPSAPVTAGSSGRHIYTYAQVLNKGRISSTKPTWRLGVEFDLTPTSLLYATYETGYHSGGFTIASFIPTYRPETIQAFTIGSKNRFLDGRVQLNLELFYWKYKDQQVSHFTYDVSGALTYATENAGSSTNKGAEISLLAKPFRRTTINAAVEYLDATYDRFSYNSPNIGGLFVTSCATTPNGAFVKVDCSGFRALRSPEWTINAGVEQVIPVGNELEIVANVDTHYQSGSVLGVEMIPNLSVQKGYWKSDASIGFGPSDGKWQIAAYITNIENNRPFTEVNPGWGATFGGTVLPPRRYGLKARFAW